MIVISAPFPTNEVRQQIQNDAQTAAAMIALQNAKQAVLNQVIDHVT